MSPNTMLAIAGINPQGAGPCVEKLRQVWAKKCAQNLEGYHVARSDNVSASDEALAFELLEFEWALQRGHAYPWVENPRWWHFLYHTKKMIAKIRSWVDRKKKPFGMEKP